MVVDTEERESIEDANIEVDEKIFEDASDEEGKYSIEVAVGVYDVTARKGGYASDIETDVEVIADEITEGVDFFLAPYGID